MRITRMSFGPSLRATAAEPAGGAPLIGRGVLDGPAPAPGWLPGGDPPRSGWPGEDPPPSGWLPADDPPPPGWPRRGGVFVRPSRRLLLIALLLAASGLLGARIAAPGSAAPGGARPLLVATFDRVGYALIGVSVTRRIAQRGGPALRASGTFAILKLRLRSADARPHVSATDLLSLDAGGIGYGVSNPDDIGLSDRRWGAAWGAIRVPAGGSLTIKAVFEIPVVALRHQLRLHIGGAGLAAQAPGRIIALTVPAACCAAGRPSPPRRGEAIGSLGPDPVLGAGPPTGGQEGAGVAPPLGAPGFVNTVRLG